MPSSWPTISRASRSACGCRSALLSSVTDVKRSISAAAAVQRKTPSMWQSCLASLACAGVVAAVAAAAAALVVAVGLNSFCAAGGLRRANAGETATEPGADGEAHDMPGTRKRSLSRAGRTLLRAAAGRPMLLTACSGNGKALGVVALSGGRISGALDRWGRGCLPAGVSLATEGAAL